MKAAQTCAKIDPHPYEAAVDQARADLEAAKAQFEKNKAELARAQVLFERHETLAKRRAYYRRTLDRWRDPFEQAQTQTKLNEATVAQLQTAIKTAETNLGDTDIVSPIDGTVVSRNVETGMTVAAGSQTPLFLVAADLSVLHVDANVSKTGIGKVNLGDKATFTVVPIPNRTFPGEVTQIGPSQTIENVETYDVVITASNQELLLEPSMTATIQIVIDRRDGVLRVPDEALRYSPSGRTAPSGSSSISTELDGWPLVWILRDGRPAAMPVQLGVHADAYTEIVKGNVKPGDDLIVGESGGHGN